MAYGPIIIFDNFSELLSYWGRSETARVHCREPVYCGLFGKIHGAGYIGYICYYYFLKHIELSDMVKRRLVSWPCALIGCVHVVF